LNTGNVSLRYKVDATQSDGLPWEMRNEWKNIAIGEYSENIAASFHNFIVDTNGVAFDAQGVEDLGFRSNSSMVVSLAYPYNGIWWLISSN
jgi:hypothetical protein